MAVRLLLTSLSEGFISNVVVLGAVSAAASVALARLTRRSVPHSGSGTAAAVSREQM